MKNLIFVDSTARGLKSNELIIGTLNRSWRLRAFPRLYCMIRGVAVEIDSLTDLLRGTIDISMDGGKEAIDRRLRFAAQHASEHERKVAEIYAFRHMLMLGGPAIVDGWFVCPICSRRYKQSTAFARHLCRTHRVDPARVETSATQSGWFARRVGLCRRQRGELPKQPDEAIPADPLYAPLSQPPGRLAA